MAEAAASDPAIGTVTPLSNNGEETSFPLANEANPIGTIDDVLAIDAIAATVNAGRVVDIPNGTGFCLYVTRECLDAAFPFRRLSSRLRGGCRFLFARALKGFRNSARPPSMSATPAANHLVKKSARWWFATFDTGSQYPAYQANSAAFNCADPLARARQQLSARWLVRQAFTLIADGDRLIASSRRSAPDKSHQG